MSFFEFLLEIEGVVGAVFGVASTLIITHYLKNKGKLQVILRDPLVEYSKYNDWGIHTTCVVSDAEFVTYKFNVELYNPSETNRAAKDFEVIFYQHNQEIIRSRIIDNEKTIYSESGLRYIDADFYNIKPKEFVKKSFVVSLKEEEIVEVVNATRIDMEFSTLKGNSIKSKLIKVKKIKFEETNN